MKNSDFVRAWKDPNYRKSLSDVERNRVPPNPAGLTEPSDAELSDVAGGAVGSIHTGRPCLPPTAYHCTFYCPAIL
jgi:mersacidin/lichenicidin family type 2 lantibiotic